MTEHSIQAETVFYAVDEAEICIDKDNSVVLCGVVIEQTINGKKQFVVLASPNQELAEELKDHILDGIRTYCGSVASIDRSPRKSDA